MSSVDLAPYEFLLFDPTKGSLTTPKHLSVLRVREIDRIQKRLAARAVLFYADTANVPTIWVRQTGPKRIKDISYAKTQIITHIVSDGSFAGLFLLSKKGVDFVLLEHVLDKPWKLRSTPRSFSKELHELVSSPRDHPPNTKKEKNATQGFFIVYNARLKYFAAKGALILAVLVRDTQEGGLHLLVGCLVRKLWRRWDVEEDYAVNSGIYIDPNSGSVTLLRCSIDTPVKAMQMEETPSAPSFSLTVFALIEPVSRCRGSSQSSTIACAFYHEIIVNLTDPNPPMRRTFQSLGFIVSPSEGDNHANCPVTVESTPIPLFSFLMRVGSESFILQLTYSSNKDELVAVCQPLPVTLQISNPLALATMQLSEDPQHPGGPRATFILTKDLKLFAFDGASTIEVRVFLANRATNDLKQIGQQMLSERKLPKLQQPTRHSDFKAGAETATDAIKLLPIGQHELFCTDGRIAVFLHLKGVDLKKKSLNEKVMSIASDILEPKNVDESVTFERSLALLSDILVSESVGRQELGEILLRQIAPALRRAVLTPAHTLLIHRVFLLLLQLFSPVTDADWKDLSTLTRILQFTMDGRSRANHIVYTDQFFSNLIEQYHRNNPHLKIETKTINQRLRDIIFNKENYSTNDKDDYGKSRLSTEFLFFLDNLSTHAPLLSFAEEVVRRCVVLEALPSGDVCAILPKEGCGMVVHAMGIVLLASCFDIHLFVGVDNETEAITWSLVQREPPCIDVPPYAFTDAKKVEYAFTLAVDLLSIQTTDLPYSLCIPIVLLAVGQRRHSLISLLKLFSLQIAQSLNTGTLFFANNTEWLEDCAVIFKKKPNEVVRTFLQASTKDDSLKSIATGSALCYALYEAELSNNLSLVNYIQESISQELCIASIVMFLFTVTESLIDARNNYASSIKKNIFDEDGVDKLQAEEVALCKRQFHAAIEHTLAAWVKANAVLPYKARDLAASYEASISMSFSNTITLTDHESTVVLRTLVLCFRILVLVYYSEMLEQRLEKTVLHCENNNESCDDINEDYPAVHGSLEALHTIHALHHSGLQLEKFQGQLLKMLEAAADICVVDKHLRSAPWCFFFMHVLSLSGISETAIVPLRKRYCTLLGRLQNQLSKLENQEAIDDSIRSFAKKAKAMVYAMSANDDHEKQVFYIFSHSRDSRIPQWVRDQASPAHKYLITANWTQQMWPIEGRTDIIKEAIDLLISHIEEETSKAGSFINKAGPDDFLKEQSKTLFNNISHILLPSYSSVGTECPMPARDVQDSYYIEEGKRSVEKGEKGGICKEDIPLKTPSQGVPLALGKTLEKISPRPIIEVAKTEEISPHARSPLSVHSQVKPSFAASDRLTFRDVERSKGVSPTLNKEPCATMYSMEDEPALSDTATTCTTTTSKCFTGTDASHNSREEPLRSDNGTDYEEMSTSNGVKYHKKRCHHHHHHHHHSSFCCCRCKRSCQQLNSTRVRFDQSSDAWIGGDQDARMAPRLTISGIPPYSNEFQNDLHSRKTGIPVQQSSTVLRPPPEPPRMGPIDDFQTPIYQRIDAIQPNAYGFQAQDSNRVPSLLTFSRHQGQQSCSPKVRLYSAQLGDSEAHMNGFKKSVECMDITASSPFLNNVIAYTGAQYLEVPPIPSTDVFQKPPPLLHLRGRVVIGETTATTATSNDLPTASIRSDPYKSTFPDATYSSPAIKPLASVPESPQELQPPQPSQERTHSATEQLFVSLPSPNLLVQVPREQTVPVARDDVKLVPEQPASNTPILQDNHGTTQSNTEAKSLTVPDVKQPFLTSIEMNEFKRYADDLISKINVAPSVPVSLATTNSAAPPLTSNDFSHSKQQPALPVTVGDSLCQKSENVALYPPIPKLPQPTLAPTPLVHSLPLYVSHEQHGLTPLEQAQLLQKSIKQKNELLNLNLELSEIQLRAARIGEDSAFKLTAATEERKGHLLGYGKDQALSQMQSPRDSVKPQPMLSAQTQTQTLAINDASVGAALPPFHSTSAAPSSDVVSGAPVASIANTISDLEHLNAKLQAMNSSTDAMEKALHGTRETIRSYEKLKAMEGMNVEEIALLNSLRCKTAAAERRLMELQGLTMTTQIQSSPQESQIQSCQKPFLGASADYDQHGQDRITKSQTGTQEQSVAKIPEKRFISFSTREITHSEEPERKEVSSTEQQRSDGATSALLNARAPDPQLFPSPSSEIKQTEQLTPQPALIAPRSPYQTATFASPTTREYLSAKQYFWRDADVVCDPAKRDAALTNAKAISSVNSQNGLSVCQGAPPHNFHTAQSSKSIAVPSFVGPTDLRALYEAAPKRLSERIREQRCRSAPGQRRKMATSGAGVRPLPSRTASKDVPDRFYMYRSQSCIPKANKKNFTSTNARKCVTPFSGLENRNFFESADVAVSNGILPSKGGSQIKVMDSVFVERQRRRRSDNIEKRIHQLEREFA